MLWMFFLYKQNYSYKFSFFAKQFKFIFSRVKDKNEKHFVKLDEF